VKKHKGNSVWQPVKDFMGSKSVLIGSHHTFHFLNSPRKILHMMSYYKFAAKVIGGNKNVLDMGCGEGLGAWLLAKECGKVKGIDLDKDAIEVAKSNWKDPRISFKCANFLKTNNGVHDAVVSFDVVEHILPKNAGAFFKKIGSSLTNEGVVIVGTPNITSAQYASAVTKLGHVNLYSGERLEKELKEHFKFVFMFGANDEVVHTGYLPMAHYLIAVACHKK
jgi:2-polyprenyl-3-methyl-5-hydroxy-6-metoxy-1,4-benzoquinol methylase